MRGEWNNYCVQFVKIKISVILQVLKQLKFVAKSGQFRCKRNRENEIYEVAKKYKEEDIPLVVLAGKEYGTGSSRDWAAKGTKLLGIKVVIAESFERIHRSNLVGMGVLPLQINSNNLNKIQFYGKEIFNKQSWGKFTNK